MEYKHLSLDNRLEIERGLKEELSLIKISTIIGKNRTTVSREIKSHLIVQNTGAVGRKFNNCFYRKTCQYRGSNCKISHCSNFLEEKCSKLMTPPYVCNGCKSRTSCTLTKHFYNSNYANQEYEQILSEARSGIVIDQNEIENLNHILVPLVRDQHQSIHHACVNNSNKIMHSEKTIYKLIDLSLLDIGNLDLPRKVRFRQRKKHASVYKVDKKCLNGRTYEDFLEYLKQNPDISVVQIDTVEGKKGGKVLLTIHFTNISFMIAFIRDHNDAQSVIDSFNLIYNLIGQEKFKELFPIILTDNGSEFSNPTAIELDSEIGAVRTKIFYCHPYSPYEKGSCEVNHEFLRRVFPKGTSFDDFTQEDINLVMSHINSYSRKKLNNKPPYFLFSTVYGKDIADKLGIQEIEPNNVSLSKSILKK